MKLPNAFVENIANLFRDKAELDAFLASLRDERHYGLRANTLKADIDDFLKIFNRADALEPIPWCEEGFYYNAQKEAAMGKNPLYNAGLYYIQEPSAMSAVSLLNVEPGDKVLDLCASPGGKSTQIAAKLQGRGLLVSNDANFSRMPQLLKNVEMAGIKNIILLCEMADRLATKFEGFFDKILIDAPCSGEGMFRKDPTAITAWDEKKPARLAVIQKDILKHTATMLAPNGVMVYSTCTFNTTENEDVIEDFLANHKDFQLVASKRIFPHRDRGEGHFVASLRRVGDDAKKATSLSKVASFKNIFFNEFCDKYALNLPEGQIFQHKDKLFLAPEIYPNLDGLRTVRVGLFLGTLKKQRFEPSYALALSLKKGDFSQVIDLDPNDPKVAKFLKGETFEVDAADGYNLFCVAGYSIGFAKVLRGRVKGHI